MTSPHACTQSLRCTLHTSTTTPRTRPPFCPHLCQDSPYLCCDQRNRTAEKRVLGSTKKCSCTFKYLGYNSDILILGTITHAGDRQSCWCGIAGRLTPPPPLPFAGPGPPLCRSLPRPPSYHRRSLRSAPPLLELAIDPVARTDLLLPGTVPPRPPTPPSALCPS